MWSDFLLLESMLLILASKDIPSGKWWWEKWLILTEQATLQWVLDENDSGSMAGTNKVNTS